MANVSATLRFARKHLGKGEMVSSARLCLSDAVEAYDRDDWLTAQVRALKSIAYSVGVFHADYRRCDK